MKHIP